MYRTFLVWNFLTIDSKSTSKAVDSHHFYVDLDPFLTLRRIQIHLFTLMRIVIRIRLFFHSGADLDPDLDTHRSDANLLTWSAEPPSAPFLTSMPPLWAPTALHCSISSLYSSWILILMRIWLPLIMRFRADPQILDPQPSVHRYDFIIGYMGTGTVPTITEYPSYLPSFNHDTSPICCLCLVFTH